MSGWFDYGRLVPLPAIYPEWKTPVTADVLEAGWVAAFFTLFLAFVAIIPAFSGISKLFVFLRITFMLLLGLAIMLCNFGQEWEVGRLETKTAYRAGTHEEITAAIAVKLGLRSVNITLKALEEPHGALAGENIDYNERFSWTWEQGRAGFGPFAGLVNREYRAAQHRGSPLPVLWLAEYFTFDGEGLRWGRHYRTAGWFAHICVWFAFPLWLLTLILAKMVLSYAALTLTLTGASLIASAVIWASVRNSIELAVPFDAGVLTTHYGAMWWLALVAGCVCVVVGLLVYVLNDVWPNQTSVFFGNDPLQYTEEAIEYKEAGQEDSKDAAPATNDEIEMGRLDDTPAAGQLVWRRRAKGSSKKHWKNKALPVNPHLRPVDESGFEGYNRGNDQTNQGYNQHNQGYNPHNQGYLELRQGHGRQKQGSTGTDHKRGERDPGYALHNQGYSQSYEDDYSDVAAPDVQPNQGYRQQNQGYRQQNQGYRQQNQGYRQQNQGYRQQNQGYAAGPDDDYDDIGPYRTPEDEEPLYANTS